MMIKFVAFLFSILLFFSCHSSKRLANEVSSDFAFSSDSSSFSSMELDVSKNIGSDSNESFEEKNETIVIFDTDKSSVDGISPIKEIRVISWIKNESFVKDFQFDNFKLFSSDKYTSNSDFVSSVNEISVVDSKKERSRYMVYYILIAFVCGFFSRWVMSSKWFNKFVFWFFRKLNF